MYCQNCGKQIPDNVVFCSHCGTRMQNSQPTQQPVYPQSPVTNDDQPDPPQKPAKKWYQKTPIIILALIFFFPIGLFLMWKYSGWKKAPKIIITVFLAILTIGFIASGSDSEENPTLPNSESDIYAAQSTTPITTTTAEDKDASELTSISNLTTDEAKKILEDLKAVGFEHIDNAVINSDQSNADVGASFTVSYNGYSAILIVIERKTDYIVSGDIVLYKDGKVVNNINNYTISDAEKGEFIYYAKEFVKQGLKAPSTAEFPGTLLGISDWKVSRNKDVVTVQSYVDSQNGFGAMIRSNFAVQMSYSSKDCLYVVIDGTVVYGNPQ